MEIASLIILGIIFGWPLLMMIFAVGSLLIEKLEKFIKESSVAFKNSALYEKLKEELKESGISIEDPLLAIREYKNALEVIAKEKSKGFPWLSEAYADFFYLLNMKIADYFETKSHPAPKAAEKIREIARARREIEMKLRQAQYIIKYFLSLVPSLEEWIGEEDDELIKAVLSREVDEPFFTLKAYWFTGQDPARRYLSKEEWEKLPRLEKLQLALERYWNPKNRFEAGIMYERYIGYLYETNGWDVYYSGIQEGKADLGRDLIAKKGDTTKIIQCKRWSSPRFKIINEKHIFQLFGTAFQYKLEHPEENVIAAFYTTTEVSDLAKKFAEELSRIIPIEIYANFPLQKYPLVKCNVSRRTGEKIYHLPFDQQYDRTLIEEERNECYVETVAEAERLGYRRAFRWRGNVKTQEG